MRQLKTALYLIPLAAIGLVFSTRPFGVRPDGASAGSRLETVSEVAATKAAASRPIAVAPRTALPITPVTAQQGRFALRDGAVSAFFTDQGLALSLMNGARKGVAAGLFWNLVGANRVDPRPEGETAARVHSLIGERAQWHVDQHGYSRMAYDQIRPGIDLVVEARPQGVKYSLKAAAGSTRSIPIRYEGAQELRMLEDGAAIEIVTALGSLREDGLVCYQEGPQGRTPVAARYVVTGPDAYSIELGEADPTRPIVIDPLIGWSTYLGGTDGLIDEEAKGVAIDSAGNVYVGGWTGSSNFPTTPGAFQTVAPNWPDAFVAKFSPAGAMVWATYLGGYGGEVIRGIAVDSSGQVVVTGYTGSPNFPVVNAWDSTYSDPQEAFVAQLNADGSGLLWSTFLGGSSVDSGTGVAIDGSGNVLVSGYTDSTDFPVTSGSGYGGGMTDGFVAKFSAGGASLVWARYFGGTGQDSAEGVAVDSSGNAYATGFTDSTDFPVTHTYQMFNRGAQDAFILKTFADGTLAWSTYFGGNGSDFGNAIAVDASGNPCVTGTTSSSDLPTQFNILQPTSTGGPDAFVVKMPSFGSSPIWSTYLGGASSDFGNGIAVDADGNVIVTGLTYGAGFPAIDSPQSNSAGLYDVFVTRIRSDGTAADWSLIVGGAAEDVGNAVALGPDGLPVVVGITKSPDFPTVDAFSATLGGTSDAFVLKLKPTPPVPTDLAQQRVDGTPIAVGGWAPGTVVLSAIIGGTEDARLEIEIKPIDLPLTGVPTHLSSPTAGGAIASVTVGGLITDKYYQWRARQVTATGVLSGWVSFGGNGEFPPFAYGDSDFGVDATPPTVQITSPKGNSKKTNKPTIPLNGISGDNSFVSWVYCDNLTTGQAVVNHPTFGSQGVASWETTVPLALGVNVIQVRAVDHVGNEATDTIQVTRH